MKKEAKKRWLSLYVENQVGVLARIAGLFSGKSYNLHSLTVGETQDRTISRMTICVEGDDDTFEQIKKQLNRCVEVIKVVDLTSRPVRIKELLFLKVKGCKEDEKRELFRMAELFDVKIADYKKDTILFECLQTEAKNDTIIELITGLCPQVEVVRGGCVAIEAVSITES